MSPADAIPLCVDLDGTVIKTDLLWESMLRLVARNPFYLFVLPFWFLRGRAHLKSEIARRIELNPASLPCHTEFVEFLREQHAHGRRVVLATASNHSLAECVAAHLGVFSEVIASDHHTNLRSRAKAARLVERFGHRGFDYAGNSNADRAVWREARHAIVVGAPRRDLPDARVFPAPGRMVPNLFRLLRPHHWTKNFIIFAPLLTAHQLGNSAHVRSAALAFVAFSLCASALYVLNDLLDLDADRHHANKRGRPFASGALPIPLGLVLVPLLLAGAAAFTTALPGRFALVIAAYFGLTTAYSYWIKRLALLDVFLLAGLYTIRLVAGHEATGVAYSAWLLVFSMFIFLSLALVKRFQELKTYNSHSPGRGYTPGDLELIASLGSSSGYLSVLVLALYVNSEQVRTLYHHPLLLLLICPLFLFWISRIWLLAHRGQLHDDPVLFALRDRMSYLVGLLTLLIIWIAR
jgi:4-hydroxybenzoate polyprenyltransferase/phosphoserine phosphatase